MALRQGSRARILKRAEADAVRIDRHVLQRPERAQCRAIERVIDHKIVDKEPAARLQGLVRILVEGAKDRLGDGAGDVCGCTQIEKRAGQRGV